MEGYAGFQNPGMPHLTINTEDSQPIPQASSRMVPYTPAAGHQGNFPPQSARNAALLRMLGISTGQWGHSPTEGAYATRFAPQCLTRACVSFAEQPGSQRQHLSPSVQSCFLSVSHNHTTLALLCCSHWRTAPLPGAARTSIVKPWNICVAEQKGWWKGQEYTSLWDYIY